MCDQVVALLSAEHSAFLVWGDDEGGTESVDIDPGEDDRLFMYEVADLGAVPPTTHGTMDFKRMQRVLHTYRTIQQGMMLIMVAIGDMRMIGKRLTGSFSR
jgi:hypothetical protein